MNSNAMPCKLFLRNSAPDANFRRSRRPVVRRSAANRVGMTGGMPQTRNGPLGRDAVVSSPAIHRPATRDAPAAAALPTGHTRAAPPDHDRPQAHDRHTHR